MSTRFWLAALLAALVQLDASAAEVPFLSGRVNDLAELLKPSTVAELESVLKSHEDSTSNQVVVLTIPSLEGEPLEEYSIRVAETWKLGQKGKDNGVLLLVSRNDRKVRIEVGRGLEGYLTDQLCGMIIRHEIVPRFRDGDFDGGVRAGVVAVLQVIQGSYVAEEEGELGDLPARLVGFLLFLIVVGIFTIIAVFSKGFMSWFLYFFLMPFWGLFPTAMLGQTPGLTLFAAFVIGFPLIKAWFRNSTRGMALMKRAASSPFFTPSSAGGWSSSSGGGFSGGGGSFGGGGSSGSW
jgi:uncharacterized protein